MPCWVLLLWKHRAASSVLPGVDRHPLQAVQDVGASATRLSQGPWLLPAVLAVLDVQRVASEAELLQGVLCALARQRGTAEQSPAPVQIQQCFLCHGGRC